MYKEYKMFERDHIYDFTFELEQDISVAEKIISKIPEEHILTYQDLGTIEFYVGDDSNFIGHDLIKWLGTVYHKGATIRDSLLEISIEDKEWTARRNKDLNSIYYRMITFNEDAQQAAIDYLQNAINDMKKLLRDWETEIKEESDKKEIRKSSVTVLNEYKYVKPRGGENGVDGYCDADYKLNETGEVVRFISRDVFDFGVLNYPQRLDKTDDIFNKSTWTNTEMEILAWLAEFGKFHGIRM